MQKMNIQDDPDNIIRVLGKIESELDYDIEGRNYLVDKNKRMKIKFDESIE